ncbi:MAG: OB-fold domain-containing protein [Deltaproteobacteria bacterium]
MSLAGADFPLPDLDWEPTRPFWQGAARGELCLPRCAACATWIWYPKETCPACGAAELAWEKLCGRATLFSFVVVRHAFLPQYRDLIPFVAALVVPEEAPAVRLTTRLIDCDPEQLKIEMPLEVVFAPLEFAGAEGSVPAPLFRPAS